MRVNYYCGWDDGARLLTQTSLSWSGASIDTSPKRKWWSGNSWRWSECLKHTFSIDALIFLFPWCLNIRNQFLNTSLPIYDDTLLPCVFFLSSEKDGGFPILAYRWRSPAGKPPFVSGCQKIVKMKTSALIGSGKTSREDSELPLTLFLNQIQKKNNFLRPPFCSATDMQKVHREWLRDLSPLRLNFYALLKSASSTSTRHSWTAATYK